MKTNIPLILLQGPTAAGKSALALEIAQRLGTDIISADSRQIYKYMDIGTAKPSREEQQLVRHHLIDIVYPDQKYNAGKFAHDATRISESLKKQNKIAFVVGGTGFYTKALTSGLAAIPEIPLSFRKELIQSYDKTDPERIFEKLQEADPIAAAGIKANDVQKMLRALEVYEFTGRPISSFWKEQQEKDIFRTFNIFLSDSRELIYERIDKRIERMMESGLLKEINGLFEKGYREEDPGMNAVGYKEFFPYLKTGRNLDECREEAKKSSRNLAKRQLTWFKKIGFDLTLTTSDINISYVLNKIKGFIKGDL